MSGLTDSEEIVEIDDENEEYVTDNKVLLNYDSYVITSHDYSTLESGEFLNDSVIDFYLIWLLKEKVIDDERDEIHVFSSHFFSRLISKPSLNTKVQAFERDPNKSKAEKAHLRVKGWTKKFDIFNKKLVIIPICQSHHWFMILICNPDCVGLEEQEQKIKGEPFFVLLDSFGHRRPKEIDALRTYLRHEYLEKRKETFSFGASSMKAHYPRLPQQMNSTDCGVYLLEYAERIIEKRYMFRWPPFPDLSHWFSESEVHSKRPCIAQLIQTLSKDLHPKKYSLLTFPPISFSPIDVDEIDDGEEIKGDESYVPPKRHRQSPGAYSLRNGTSSSLSSKESNVVDLNKIDEFLPSSKGIMECSVRLRRMREDFVANKPSSTKLEEGQRGLSEKNGSRILKSEENSSDEEPIIRRVRKRKKFTLFLD